MRTNRKSKHFAGGLALHDLKPDSLRMQQDDGTELKNPLASDELRHASKVVGSLPIINHLDVPGTWMFQDMLTRRQITVLNLLGMSPSRYFSRIHYSPEKSRNS